MTTFNRAAKRARACVEELKKKLVHKQKKFFRKVEVCAKGVRGNF